MALLRKKSTHSLSLSADMKNCLKGFYNLLIYPDFLAPIPIKTIS